MIKILLPVLAMISVVSCKEVQPIVCDAQKMAVSKVAAVFGEKLQCSGLASLEADLNKQMEPLKLCEAAITVQSTPMSEFICPLAVKYVVDFGVTKLPAAWECKGGIAVEKLNEVLLNACLGK